ncbi:MrcB family domain-containing protein [Chloroflexota bacterium]
MGAELAAFYEPGNVYAVYYPTDKLPVEDQLIVDFREMLRIYEFLSYGDNIPTTPMQVEQDESGITKGLEDLTKLREHKRIERNARLSRDAKKIHGYICQACGFDFSRIYGDLGKDFIEAHHLKPITELKGKVVELDPRPDFAVLCSNCHSMIHRFDKPEDIEAFRKILNHY